MTNDTVREDMKTSVTALKELRAVTSPAPIVERTTVSRPPMLPATPPPIARGTETAGLVATKTSPTLVGFQNQNAALPDWRIQLQNAVQKRKGAQNSAGDAANAGRQFPINGATALKPEIVQRIETEPKPRISDPIVAKAMRRIEESRKAFLETGTSQKRLPQPHPFGIVTPNGAPSTAAAPARIVAMTKPRLVNPPLRAEKRDTNKLPPIDLISSGSNQTDAERVETTPDSEFAEIKRIRIRAESIELQSSEISETLAGEIEDLAPFSMRFGAGLFDIIIGLFAGMLLLSPIAFTRGDWFTTAGLLTFAATSAIVLFLYMTVCLGFFGKTMGMRLFSLELVDAVENEYPSLRQAAVNSSVFLLSLPFAGAGFLTVFYNEEKRALHDLLSGTILVREF